MRTVITAQGNKVQMSEKASRIAVQKYGARYFEPSVEAIEVPTELKMPVKSVDEGITPPSHTNLDVLSMAELRTIARSHGVTIKVGMKKTEVIDLLKQS